MFRRVLVGVLMFNLLKCSADFRLLLLLQCFFILVVFFGGGGVVNKMYVRIHPSGPTREAPEMMVKLLYGCCILPMVILLPVYMKANLDPRPRRAVLASDSSMTRPL